MDKVNYFISYSFKYKHFNHEYVDNCSIEYGEIRSIEDIRAIEKQILSEVSEFESVRIIYYKSFRDLIWIKR
jgi:hypothetical protein